MDPQYDIDEIDLTRLVDILVAGKWLIAMVAGGVLLFGGLYAFLSTPIYRGDVLLQVEQRPAVIPGFTELMGGEPVLSSAEVELIRSRMVIGSVVDRLDLAIVSEPRNGLFRRNVGTIEVTRLEVAPHLHGVPLVLELLDGRQFELRYENGGEVLGRGRVGEPLEAGGEVALFVARLDAVPGARFRLVRVNRLIAINRLRNTLGIQERGGRRTDTGILEVAMAHPDRAYIARVLDAIAQAYVRQNVERRSEEAARSLEFLDGQLPELRRELEQAEDVFNTFRREHQAVDLDADSTAMLNQLVGVEGELRQLQMERSEQELRYGAQHPQMQALNSRIQSLERARAALETEVGGLPERQQQLLRLRREVEVNTQLYTALLNTAQELRIAQAGTVGNVRIVDEAAVNPVPVHPRKARILALSLVLGLFLGATAVFGRQMLRRGITDPDKVEAALGLPVYAVIPHSPEQKRAERDAKRSGTVIGVLAVSHPDDPTVESVRSLRTGLTFALMDAVRNVVVVTSPGPENGKTFVSMNLAQVLADGGQRVLVIDADLRRGHVARYVAARHKAPGLSEVLAGQATVESAIVPLVAGKFDVLPGATFPPNPSELLLRPEFGALLDAQRARYDLVIVDTAPILAATDGVIVAAHAGAVFLVLRAGSTTEREARAALRRLEQGQVRTTGVIVNDLNPEREGRREYYYYKYKYPTGK